MATRELSGPANKFSSLMYVCWALVPLVPSVVLAVMFIKKVESNVTAAKLTREDSCDLAKSKALGGHVT